MGPVVFDLDGVLVDSRRVYVDAFREALAQVGVKADEEEIGRPMGKPVSKVLRAMLSEHPERLQEAESIVDELINGEEVVESLSVCASAEAVLKALRACGRKTFVLTNSRRVFTEKVLRRFSLLDLFDGVLAADGKSGPKEGRLDSLLEGLGAGRDDSFYVGDLPGDVFAARDAGCVSVAVYNEFSWVYPDVGIILEAGPDYLIEDLSDLLNVLKII